jgi:hypothetical protein
MSKKTNADDTVLVDEIDEEPILIGEFETAEEAALTTNIYSEIRRRLALLGVPADQIAFIHDAGTPEARAKLFAAVNRGDVRVLIGSTEKMGTGMNVQERCIAIHTITPPWRPGDIEQQLGRVLRQGNLFPQVFQFVHVTEGSFDAYIWQLLENKVSFIAQIASGHVTSREMDDVDETVLVFSEIKALASGNPLIAQKVVLDAEFQRLSAIYSSWRSSQESMRHSVHGLEYKKSEAEARVAVYLEAIQQRDANSPEKFSVQLKPSIDGDELEIESDREAAGRKIRLLAEHAALRLIGRQRTETFIEIGLYRGFALNVTVSALDNQGRPVPQLFFRVGNEMLQVSLNTDAGVTRSMDTRLNSLDNMLAEARDFIQVTEGKIKMALDEADKPWDHEQRFCEIKAKVKELETLLNVDKSKTEGDNAAPPAPVPTLNFVRKKATQSDTAGEFQAALNAIKAMMSNPGILARFAGRTDILSAEGLGELSQEIEVKQALLDLGSTLMQLNLFGEAVLVKPSAKKGRKR